MFELIELGEIEDFQKLPLGWSFRVAELKCISYYGMVYDFATLIWEGKSKDGKKPEEPMQKRRTWFFKRRELSEYTQQVFLSTHPNQYKHNITQWKNYLKEQTVINLRGAFTYK